MGTCIAIRDLARTVASRTGEATETVVRHIKGEYNRQKSITCNDSVFTNIDTEEKAYWFGFLLADGNIYDGFRTLKVTLKLKEDDALHVHAFREFLETNASIVRVNRQCAVTVPSNRLCLDLMYHGCRPRKSLTLKFPEIDKALIRHMIRGYFDGDGCAYITMDKRKYQGLSISFLGTEQFLNNVREECGGGGCLIKRRNIYVLRYGGTNMSKRIAKWMYEDATIWLERKKEICAPWL